MAESLDERAASLPGYWIGNENAGYYAPYKIKYERFGAVVASYVSDIEVGLEGGSGGGSASGTIEQEYTPEFQALIDEWTQKIHILEAFNGRYFFGLPQSSQTTGAVTGLVVKPSSGSTSGTGSSALYTSVPIEISFEQNQLDLLEQSYQALKSSIYQSLVVQTRFKPLLDSIDLVIDGSGVSLDFTQLEAEFESRIAADQVNGLINLSEFNVVTKSMLAGTGWSGFGLMADTLELLTMTPEIVQSLKDIGVFVKGSAGFSSNAEDNVLVGNEMDDTISGYAGNDVLFGLAGNDTLSGGNDSDTLYGGAGNDTLSGGKGSDFLYGGAGDDTLHAYASSYTNYDTDANYLEGGTGNDTLRGAYGSDTYFFNLGDGQDTIYESAAADSTSVDVVEFGAGITAADVTLMRTNTYDLAITYGSLGDQVIVRNYYSNNTYRIEQIKFADGTTLESEAIYQMGMTIHGTDGADTMTGLSGDHSDTLYGGAGNDTLSGGNGADFLYGGAGDDTLHAYASSYTNYDTDANYLEGGTGNDTLRGAYGSDTYFFNLGDGQDTIYESAAADSTSVDVVEFGAGITAADVTLMRTNTYDLAITYGSLGDQVIVRNYYSNNTYRIEQIKFADGTTLESEAIYQMGMTIHGTDGADTMTGLSGDHSDTLYGGAGNDTLSGGNGADFLYGGAGNDTLHAYASSYVSSETVGNLLMGGEGADLLYGAYGSDLLIGGTGNDTITTYVGADIIAFNSGDGQDLVNASTGADNSISLGGGITYADLQFSKSGNNLILKTGGTDQITFKDWYASSTNKSVANLQVIAEAMADFDANGSDTLLDNRIETFDFVGLVDAFDQARAADTTITSWSLSDALLDFHLSGSDAEAIGGDLAYQYGVNGSLAGMGLNAVQGVMGAANFGQSAQTLNAPSTWQNEAVKLA
jgi:Ca2+-binding RTX toxin-like protein